MDTFEEAVEGLLAGDFSRLAPLFAGPKSKIIEWFEAGNFKGRGNALEEALTCACFNGCTEVARYLMDRGVKPEGGMGTGLNAFHWAANRGQFETVKLLIDRGAPLENRNSYGGTVLGCAVWSAVNEPRPDHARIVEALVKAGAKVTEAKYPSGDAQIDRALR